MGMGAFVGIPGLQVLFATQGAIMKHIPWIVMAIIGTAAIFVVAVSPGLTEIFQ